MIATQLTRLAGNLPEYQSTIQSKITALRGVTGGSSTLERAEGMLQDLSKELNKPKGSGSPSLVNEPSSGTSSNPAHMRYAVRRLRRKVPRAKIMLAVWRGGDQADAALDSAKADVIALSLREAVRICIDVASAKDIAPSKELPSVSVKLNSA